MNSFRQRLIDSFLEQERFAEGYAPTYRLLFRAVAGWLADEDDPLGVWLAEAAAPRQPFDVTLLLPAALHHDVLAEEPATAALARFYRTAGGIPPVEDDPLFAASLREAAIGRREALVAFIQRENVQTNETARGLCWLLPATLASWPRIRLVELGASAGLNLVAEHRSYRLVADGDPATPLLDLGLAPPAQFVSRVVPGGPVSEALPFPAAALPLPDPVIRLAGDQKPFPLDTPDDELKLSAFVWPDQPERLVRLREGIAALRAAATDGEPVEVAPLDLPGELAAFMDRAETDHPELPLVVYNTTMSMYLDGGAAALREAMEGWADERAPALAAPLLWLQWEPPVDGATPPEPGWSAWTADRWANGRHDRWRLAWVHPHGARLRWEPGAAEFYKNLQSIDRNL